MSLTFLFSLSDKTIRKIDEMINLWLYKIAAKFITSNLSKNPMNLNTINIFSRIISKIIPCSLILMVLYTGSWYVPQQSIHWNVRLAPMSISNIQKIKSNSQNSCLNTPNTWIMHDSSANAFPIKIDIVNIFNPTGFKYFHIIKGWLGKK